MPYTISKFIVRLIVLIGILAFSFSSCVHSIEHAGVIQTMPTKSFEAGNNFYLYGEVTDDSVSTLIDMLNAATPSDSIYIHIDSPGGLCIPGFKVVEAIQKSEAKEVVSIVDHAYSMAGIIALESDRIIMNTGSKLMIHYGGYTTQLGKSPIIPYTVKDLNSTSSYNRYHVYHMDRYLHIQDDKFLTKADWNVIHEGDMVFLTDKQFYERGGYTFDGRKISNPEILFLANEAQNYDTF